MLFHNAVQAYKMQGNLDRPEEADVYRSSLKELKEQ